MMPYTTTERPSPGASTAEPRHGCGCGDPGHTHDETCCQLVCFERPRYFCGQLLADADLSLEQTYVREKLKLYHRALDGWGVVCGLRLTCDPRCEGHIRIGDGFAVDCCGNDLVMCEPRSFDVMAELRRKGWVVEPPKDPCKKDEEPDCTGRQCYYVGICYDEQQAEFVTPFKTDCSPGPGACEPTRVREGVRFELYDELPHRPDPLDEIEERIERCFRIFREGQFSRGLEQHAGGILAILEGKYDRERFERRPYDVFCQVRALFLHQLRVCPDQYNCSMEQDVWAITCPDSDEDRDAHSYAFTRLFELVQQYVFGCVLAEFAFPCPDPPKSCCVIIGSVEVEHGRLKRVLNFPRWYLVSFANLLEVFVYRLANQAACGPERRKANELLPREARERDERKEGGCCPGFEVDVREFLTLFRAHKRAPELAARSSVQAVRAVYEALVSGFDFTKPHRVAAQALKNMPVEEAQQVARTFGFPLVSLGTRPPGDVDPLSALLAHLVHAGEEPLGVFEESRENGPAIVSGAMRILDAPARAIGAGDQSIDALKERIDHLEAAIKELRDKQQGGGGEQPQ